MNTLDELIAIKPKEEYMRLVSVELSGPTDEQLDKARATMRKNNRDGDPTPRASLRLTWEPLSYNIRGHNGNVVTDYIDVSFGLSLDELARVRNTGWLGIPDNKLVRLDTKVDAEAQAREWARYRAKTRDVLPLDIDVDGTITGKVGQPYSTAVGSVFKVTEGFDAFPRNVQNPVTKKWSVDTMNPRRAYMRYPVEVANDYVAPADVPVRIPRTTSDEAGSVLTEGATSGLTAEALRRAVIDSGMLGMSEKSFSSVTRQISFLASHIEDTDNTIVFGTGEINAAANEGTMLEHLVAKGAITIVDGMIA